MKEIILSPQEIAALKDLESNLSQTKILHDLKDYGLIAGTCTDDNGFIFVQLTVNGGQLLRQLESYKGLMDTFSFTLDLGIVKISTK